MRRRFQSGNSRDEVLHDIEDAKTHEPSQRAHENAVKSIQTPTRMHFSDVYPDAWSEYCSIRAERQDWRDATGIFAEVCERHGIDPDAEMPFGPII